ncbi:MAG: hypothetical protein VYE73_14310 [Acidobacteriota bacterium]|nr:hypothetical protein [Acidobacteriota bacterium]
MTDSPLKYRVSLIPGDGIGPEVTAAMVRAVDHVTEGRISSTGQMTEPILSTLDSV